MSLAREVLNDIHSEIEAKIREMQFNEVISLLDSYDKNDLEAIFNTPSHFDVKRDDDTLCSWLDSACLESSDRLDELKFRIAAILFKKGLKNLFSKHDWIVSALEKQPEILLKMINDKFISPHDVLMNLEKRNITNPFVSTIAGLREVLIKVLANGAAYATTNSGVALKKTLRRETQVWVAGAPCDLLSLLLYHVAILRGDTFVFDFYRENAIKIQYQPTLIRELFQAGPGTKSSFTQLRMIVEQLKAYDYHKPADLDDIVKQLCEMQLVYEHDFEYPPILQKMKQDTQVKLDSSQGLALLIPAFYVELGIDQEIKPLFFTSSTSERQAQAGVERRGFAFLEQPEASLKSLEYVLSNKHIVLSAFQKLPNQNKYDDGAIKTLCSIALQAPIGLRDRIINLIDRMTNPDYAVSDKTQKVLKQTSLLSFLNSASTAQKSVAAEDKAPTPPSKTQ